MLHSSFLLYIAYKSNKYIEMLNYTERTRVETYSAFLTVSFVVWITVMIRKHLLQDQEGQQTPYYPQALRSEMSVTSIYPAFPNKHIDKGLLNTDVRNNPVQLH